MITPLAVGTCCLIVSLSGAFLIARAWPQPSGGQHRRGTRPMLRPVEALDQFEDWCPVEHRRTLHTRLRSGGVLCMDCRNPGRGA
ncbi:hypothetical protein EDD90_3254 [Streptomyces sp. Ag109_O5-1]|uniref:hypothetical protein n=1 Tax=Streptomyces sp. Ag109_O5-1 TaxID=1938851 RepID=UPI000F4D5FE4|nr:hypothetical protein [Streptomyces sp. Ag109_O5-1]RPE40218.1 hypothetical protein EDD90_3254 [Streptomyces sp. Ag109_O5-1]